nr:reverse transcriptase domain-containing protein [Tanacetum cinerariifolium]
MATFTQALIDAFASGSPPFPLSPTSPAYDQAPLVHKAAMIRKRDDNPEEDMPPQRRFVFTAPPPHVTTFISCSCNLILIIVIVVIIGIDPTIFGGMTIPLAVSTLGCTLPGVMVIALGVQRDDNPEEDMPPQRRFVFTAPPPQCDVVENSAAARALREDIGYVRALQTSKHRMMTSIKEVNLRISYQAQVHRQESKYFYTQLHDTQTDRRDIRLEIDVVRGPRTAYETELQEDEDTKEDEPSKGSDETKPFEEDKTAVIPPTPRHHGAISVRPQTPMATFTQVLIDAFASGSPPFPLSPTSPAYDQAPLVHKTAMILTYTSISSNSDGPSWGIPLMNADELPEMDPYEEVAQQGQVPPLSPMYVPDLIKLGEHVPVYVLEPDHPEYHTPSDDDIQVKDQPHADDASPTIESPGYIAESNLMGEDDDEDSEEDPSEELEPEDDDEEHEEDPNEEHEPEDEDTKEDEPSEGSDETEPFKEDETAVTPPPPRHSRARISAPLGHMAAMIYRRDDIPKEDMPPQRRFVFITPLPGCDVVESSAAARAPRGQYDFVDTVEAGQGLICSPGHDAQTIAKVADRAKDVGYVRALQASEHRMMAFIEELNLRISYQAQVRRQESKYFYTQLHDAQTDRRDIRLEIDVVRGQRTAYETYLQEVRQADLSSEAQNRALLARLETLETHISRMEWQRQSAEDLKVTQMMRIHALEARAQTDTVEDTSSSLISRIMPVTRQGTNDAMTSESIEAMIDWAIQRNFTHTQDDASQSSSGGLRRPVQPNDNKRKADDSSRNNQQQQPHKKKNVAKAYTAGLVKRGLILETYLCTPSAITITPGNVYPSVETARGMVIPPKINCPKLKNYENGNENGVAQGRACSLGGGDSIPESTTVTDTFLLNNRYALILFDTGADRSFVSTAFSALLNILRTVLDNHYDVELADGKII